jgi:hypothetical protein
MTAHQPLYRIEGFLALLDHVGDSTTDDWPSNPQQSTGRLPVTACTAESCVATEVGT